MLSDMSKARLRKSNWLKCCCSDIPWCGGFRLRKKNSMAPAMPPVGLRHRWDIRHQHILLKCRVRSLARHLGIRHGPCFMCELDYPVRCEMRYECTLVTQSFCWSEVPFHTSFELRFRMIRISCVRSGVVQTHTIPTYWLLIVSVCRISDHLLVQPVAPRVRSKHLILYIWQYLKPSFLYRNTSVLLSSVRSNWGEYSRSLHCLNLYLLTPEVLFCCIGE